MSKQDDVDGMAMEDTTAKPPINAPTSAVLEGPLSDDEDAEHVEPPPDEVVGSEGD